MATIYVGKGSQTVDSIVFSKTSGGTNKANSLSGGSGFGIVQFVSQDEEVVGHVAYNEIDEMISALNLAKQLWAAIS